jgi:hypothetical protein
MDLFNFLAGVVSIASFVFAFALHIKRKALLGHLEAGLLGLIGTLDKIAAMGGLSGFSKKDLRIAAEGARDQSIALLKSFSVKEQRLPTYDFGIDQESIEETMRKRKETLGLDEGVFCIVQSQQISYKESLFPVETVSPGIKISAYDENIRKIVLTKVKAISQHIAPAYLVINDSLSVTGNHQVLCRNRGWIPSSDLVLGDELMTNTGHWKPVVSTRVQKGVVRVYSVSTEIGNLFANGFLVHNKQ